MFGTHEGDYLEEERKIERSEIDQIGKSEAFHSRHNRLLKVRYW